MELWARICVVCGTEKEPLVKCRERREPGLPLRNHESFRWYQCVPCTRRAVYEPQKRLELDEIEQRHLVKQLDNCKIDTSKLN